MNGCEPWIKSVFKKLSFFLTQQVQDLILLLKNIRAIRTSLRYGVALIIPGMSSQDGSNMRSPSSKDVIKKAQEELEN